jgi:hypothetical protein
MPPAFIGWDGVLQTFFALTIILLISTSQVASTTGLNHHAQPPKKFLATRLFRM